MRYAELQVTSHFSFLRGASSAEELFATASALGIEALAIADRNTVAGIVRAHEAAKTTGVRLIVGCRLDLVDGTSLLVYPTDRPAYGRLCRLLSLGKRRAGKGKCELHWRDVELYAAGLLAVLVPDVADETCEMQARRLQEAFGDRGYLALTLRRRPNDQLRLYELSELAAEMGVATVVTNDVLFHEPGRRILQDVVTCIRNRTTIDDVGFDRERHADRYLKPPQEMMRLFPRYQDAVARTIEVMSRCRFSLDELKYQYPKEVNVPGLTPQQALERLTWAGAERRYPEGLPDKVTETLRHELNLIEQLGYAPYFLTVNAIVEFARSQDILCQGRGSAANSAVCYVLGITSIDPDRNDLLFERFVSIERREPPDIDVDFEHQRREIVIQWVYDTYGRDRAALTSVVIRYRSKGAIRDVGKALGLPEDVTKLLSSQVWGWSREGVNAKQAEELNLNLEDRRLVLAIELAQQLIGTPRHFSQHPGGFVLTDDRLDEMVPIEPAAMDDRQIIEWDKDDIDALKFMKVDLLALGMMSCMKRSFDMLAEYKDVHLDMSTIPAEDPRTYAMIRKADTLGVFQIESRAQMSMLPRIKPRTFYDLVIEVAIVRPGPIQGDMVHPYLRRREGMEEVSYPKPELEKVLGKTLGVPLFQEQAMRVAIECAGFTPGEADQLRRAMATFKFTGGVSHFREKLVGGMVKNGYDRDYAERTFKQLEGFGSYGFPESHAASFALIAYASSWMKCHHPEIFCASLLNSQPMGFYAPAQIVRDAREHGVEVRPVCINSSRWFSTLEAKEDGTFAVRLGFKVIRGFPNADAAALIGARPNNGYRSVDELWHRAGVPASILVLLAKGDAFRPSLGVARREALWSIKALYDKPLPLFAAAAEAEKRYITEVVEPDVTLRPMSAGAEVVQDYTNISLSLKAHPVAFLRTDLRSRRVLSCAEAMATRTNHWISTAGLVLVRQMPGSAKGVMFITIEDETGIANLIVWPKVFEQHRRIVLGASMMSIYGKVQREGDVVHLIARTLTDLTSELSSVGGRGDAFIHRTGRGDEFAHGGPGTDNRVKEPGDFRRRDIYVSDLHIDSIRVKGRNFH
ncbi:DNA polymerase [Devosia soli]|uniref:Error-prone DNA polymerase n=1 Tax=Devosia soli TaxID=361041 RepID=A0A0F5L427_9HYPH|nr:error-prone DNA polymerase [Devosia soli]KKB76980.1 DNA polymerase [Devosia soli]